MEATSYVWAFIVLGLVLLLIVASAWLVRRLGLIPGSAAVTRTGRRLHVIEVMPVDVRRKLVIVRRDAVEHLLLLGAQSEILVERGFEAPTTESPEDAA